MSYLLDTDWVVDYLKGIDVVVRDAESLAQAGAALSIITYGEIYEGIYVGRNQEQHKKGFSGLLRIVDILPLDERVMERFAQNRGTLRLRGQIIGDFDILIAATALHHDLVLVTRNERHFGRIEGLKLHRYIV